MAIPALLWGDFSRSRGFGELYLHFPTFVLWVQCLADSQDRWPDITQCLGHTFQRGLGSLCCRPARWFHVWQSWLLCAMPQWFTFCKPTLMHSPILIVPCEELSGSLLCSGLSCGSQEMGFCTDQMLKGSFEEIDCWISTQVVLCKLFTESYGISFMILFTSHWGWEGLTQQHWWGAETLLIVAFSPLFSATYKVHINWDGFLSMLPLWIASHDCLPSLLLSFILSEAPCFFLSW